MVEKREKGKGKRENEKRDLDEIATSRLSMSSGN
jgi:hypothetical protein